MVVEQKVTSMTPLKIKSCLLGSILNNFQKGLGEENLVVSFFECAPRNRGVVFLNILTYKPKKVYEAKKTANWPYCGVTWPFSPISISFLRYSGRSNPPKGQEQPTEGRSNPPKVCLPPLVQYGKLNIHQKYILSYVVNDSLLHTRFSFQLI